MRVFIQRAALIASMLIVASQAWGSTLQEVLTRGELRHLGVPYAKFVTGAGDGLDVELIERFAKYLGVAYTYVQSDWENVIPDLIGAEISLVQEKASLGDKRPVKGDLIASGLTVLEWRRNLLLLSSPVFPTQIWLLAPSDHRLRPIDPSGSISKDIEITKAMVKGLTVMGLRNTCLDPLLYGLDREGATVIHFDGENNDLVPAMIKGLSNLVLLDLPDFLTSLPSWQGRIKVLGPITDVQEMVVAFAPDGHSLREEFESFFRKLIDVGEYRSMVDRYYPTLFNHLPNFLTK